MTHFLPVGTTLSRGDSVTVHCIVSFSCACSCMRSQTTAGTFLPPLVFPWFPASLYLRHVPSATQHVLLYLARSSGE